MVAARAGRPRQLSFAGAVLRPDSALLYEPWV